MIVNKETISNLFLSLKTTFNNAFSAAPPTWQKIAMLVPSTSSTNDYSWLSKFPKMREWIGEKTIKSLAGFNYSIRNKKFEATVAVSVDDIEDDQLGIYATQATAAGESAAQLPDDIIYDLANKAFESPCFDGQNFIDSDHPVTQEDGRIGSVSNKGTAPLSIASLAAAQASLGVGELTMLEFKDDEGQPLNITPNVLLVPPALKAVANALMTTDRLEDGKPNPFKGAFELVVSARLKSRTAWFLLDTSKPVKPFLYQLRKAPLFVQQTSMESDNVFLHDEFRFGVVARANGGYGFWQTAYGSTGTGT